MNSLSIRNLSLASFQGMNFTIYKEVNDRNYDAARMVSRLHRYTARVLKAVRKGKVNDIPYPLSMALSWACALANQKHIGLEAELWKRFPGVCPYCGGCVCDCGEERAAERKIVATTATQPASLRELQSMLARIYPKNTLRDAAMHLTEELGELDEAVEHFTGTHNSQIFDEIIVELVDVIANLCAVATCANLDLALEMEKIFCKGCPICRKLSCACGFTITTAPSGK
jgi:NTP pyrophosphatase (non-canonical NTP hydrolase)